MFQLFGRALQPELFEQLRQQLNLRARGVYSLAVVVWLMIWQRLDGDGSLASAVQQVPQGVLGDLVPRDKRVLAGRVSSNTGAYSRARKRLTQLAAEVPRPHFCQPDQHIVAGLLGRPDIGEHTKVSVPEQH